MLSVVQQECPAVCNPVGRGMGSGARTLVLVNVEMAGDCDFLMMMVISAIHRPAG